MALRAVSRVILLTASMCLLGIVLAPSELGSNAVSSATSTTATNAKAATGRAAAAAIRGALDKFQRRHLAASMSRDSTVALMIGKRSTCPMVLTLPPPWVLGVVIVDDGPSSA